MIITSVRAHKLESGPGFNNRAIDAEAVVRDGDDPEAVLAELQAWVDRQLRQAKEFDGLLRDLDQARAAVREVERRHDAAAAEVKRLSAIIKSHADFAVAAEKAGLKLPVGYYDDEIPF